MYEDAASTKLIATHCACCNRPLRDAASVEAGVGPECRRRYGMEETQVAPDWTAARAALEPVGLADLLGDQDDARARANALAHACTALGYTTLGHRLAEVLAEIRVEQLDGELAVKAPYLEDGARVWRLMMFTDDDVICMYTREQAIEDGHLFRADEAAKAAGWDLPVVLSLERAPGRAAPPHLRAAGGRPERDAADPRRRPADLVRAGRRLDRDGDVPARALKHERPLARASVFGGSSPEAVSLYRWPDLWSRHLDRRSRPFDGYTNADARSIL